MAKKTTEKSKTKKEKDKEKLSLEVKEAKKKGKERVLLAKAKLEDLKKKNPKAKELSKLIAKEEIKLMELMAIDMTGAELVSMWDGMEMRQKHFRKKIKSPWDLMQYAVSYMRWVDHQPFYKNEVLKGGNAAGTVVKVQTIRPYTWQGFETFLFRLGIISRLDAYRNNYEGLYTDFDDVVKRIDKMFFAQKFEGAAVGAFNATIVTRDLGLAEKSEQKVAVEQPMFSDDK